jgi:dihydroorotase
LGFQNNSAQLDEKNYLNKKNDQIIKNGNLQNKQNSNIQNDQIDKIQNDRSSKVSRIKITTEVTPHHLLLNKDSDLGAFGKVNPPLRRIEDQTALWSAFNEGIIQLLASDHAPHTIDEKTCAFNEAPAGLPGVETMLPLMLSCHKHHKVPLNRLINSITTLPASLLQIPKGILAVGYDADLVVVDFYNETGIKTENLHSKCSWTPFEKMNAIFPILTVVRGKIIIKDGNLEADVGFGKFYN